MFVSCFPDDIGNFIYFELNGVFQVVLVVCDLVISYFSFICTDSLFTHALTSGTESLLTHALTSGTDSSFTHALTSGT